jgi:DNA polymerase-1
VQQQHALRTAINAPMQGTSADIIKRAMLTIQEWIDSENNNVKMIMQVHDELVFEMPADNAKNYAEKIRLMMEDAATLNVPLLVDVGIGNSWQEAH